MHLEQFAAANVKHGFRSIKKKKKKNGTKNHLMLKYSKLCNHLLTFLFFQGMHKKQNTCSEQKGTQLDALCCRVSLGEVSICSLGVAKRHFLDLLEMGVRGSIQYVCLHPHTPHPS